MRSKVLDPAEAQKGMNLVVSVCQNAKSVIAVAFTTSLGAQPLPIFAHIISLDFHLPLITSVAFPKPSPLIHDGI